MLISLTGGLGNQLFQLAFASYSSNEDFGLEWKIAKPRLNSSGLPEVYSFRLPEKSHLVTNRGRGAKLVSKSQGFILRMGHSPRGIEKLRFIQFFIKQVANSICFIYFREIRRVVSATNIGYCDVNIPNRKVLIVGYFQSYKWANRSDVYTCLANLELQTESSELKHFINLAKSEIPLIVHVRLGDYLLEDDFGIPSSEYYRRAMLKMLSSFNYRSIWIFSDEVDKAKSYLAFDLPLNIRWISAINNSSSETLELMRHGYGYIIGNSTFSWWGAFLSHNVGASVIAPMPWFRNLSEPVDIIPPTWTRLSAEY